ncbi:MAG: hypothetical protein HRF43_05860, partial [Phycisphaerae bacterium]
MLASLSGRSIERGIQVLAEALSATVAVFDESGELLAGPAAGNEFMRRVLSSEPGRQAVLSAHRSEINRESEAAMAGSPSLRGAAESDGSSAGRAGTALMAGPMLAADGRRAVRLGRPAKRRRTRHRGLRF